MIEVVEPGTVLVIIPTYNELENLPVILRRVRAALSDAHVLVVDDKSPDGTGEVADHMAAVDAQIHVLHRQVKAGLGAAYLQSFEWGLARGYDVLVEMDADGSHQPEQLSLLLKSLADTDLVLGSRWVRGGRVENWPLRRALLSRGGNAYTRWMLGASIRDMTGGYRAFRRSTLERLDLCNVTSQGYCFQVELAWRAVARGFRVVEVPITFVERTLGASKMSWAIIAESLWRVTLWGAAHHGGRLRRAVPRGLVRGGGNAH